MASLLPKPTRRSDGDEAAFSVVSPTSPVRKAARHRLLSWLLPLGLLVSCVTNPYTQRGQLLLISPEQAERLGEEAYREILADPRVRISGNPREVDPVERVASRVIEAARRSRYATTAQRFQWQVSVIKQDETLNAFALPGGKIAVYTGIFPVAKSEAGLAAIMGHEVVHALARHGAERMSQGIVAQLVLTGAQIAGSSPDVMQALGLGAQIGVILPFGRQHESEADYIGLLLAAEAGYDPRAAVRVWQRMEQIAGQQPPEFLSTHPSRGTRIAQLQKWMPEALHAYQRAPRAPNAELPAPGR